MEIKEMARRFLAADGGEPDFTALDRLCRLATGPDLPLAAAATRAIFHGIIEPLCDDFTTRGVELCNQALARMLWFVRGREGGEALDALLGRLGFHTAGDILARYRRVTIARPMDRRRARRLVVLSRVTAGADIAVTSVIVHRLARSFPQAEIFVIGPSHVGGMFHDIPRLRHLPFVYKNDGGLVDKLTSWPRVHAMVREIGAGCPAGEILLFDPDSRLTQLGLLPLLDDEHTYYFPSRMTPPREFADKTLSFLANRWLNIVLGEDAAQPPRLVCNSEGSGFNAFTRSMKKAGCRFVATVNFGVGNDPRKQLPAPFEERLVLRLLEEPGTIVILDSGRGPQEARRVATIGEAVRKRGLDTGFFTEHEVRRRRFSFSHGLIAFKGSIEALSHLISASDCFIGYDSCGQHIAAATGTPAVIIFAGAPSQRFLRRWAPAVPHSRTIPVAPGDGIEEILRQCARETDSIRRDRRDNGQS